MLLVRLVRLVHNNLLLLSFGGTPACHQWLAPRVAETTSYKQSSILTIALIVARRRVASHQRAQSYTETGDGHDS